MSRPREAKRASKRLSARATLARVAPALANLRTEVRDGDGLLSADKAKALLRALLSDMDKVYHDPVAMADLAEAAADDPSAVAMFAYAKAGRTIANIAATRSIIDEMMSQAEDQRIVALLDVIAAATRSPSIPTYFENLLDDFGAAGMTKNGLTAAQRDGMLAIVGNPNYGKGKKTVTAPTAVGPKPVVAASWVSLPNPVPGFAFVRQKVHQNPLDRVVLDAGLPPATSIDFFVPHGSLDLANIEGDRAKAVFVWKSVETWLGESGTSDPRLDKHRKGAWTFLLGHVHGFLAGVPTMNKMTFASPWAGGEVIHATRVVEKPADG